MWKKDLVRLAVGVLLGGMVLLPACAGSTGGTTSAPSVAGARAAAGQPGPAAPTGDLLAQGKLLYEKQAGGVGCAYCHGLDGKGGGTSGVNAPPNRGKTEADVRQALLVVRDMSFIKLTDPEINAVVAYLKYLNEQP